VYRLAFGVAREPQAAWLQRKTPSRVRRRFYEWSVGVSGG
jgi:hypothetical protein